MRKSALVLQLIELRLKILHVQPFEPKEDEYHLTPRTITSVETNDMLSWMYPRG